ncbi:MAG: F0F1 ATP synthase subunit A [Dehalococcoidia bacterium]
MRNPRTIALVLGTFVLIGVGFVFFRGPKPIIEIKAETIADIGPFPLVNTYVTSIFVVLVLLFLGYRATRKLSLIPSGLQNAAEAVVEALYTVCINTAGEKHGRRFFPVVMTIFAFIWIANWMALLPFFNAIGTIEKVDAEEFHKEAVIFKDAGGIGLIMPNQKEIEFEVDPATCAAFDDEITEAKAAGEDTSGLKQEKGECVEHAQEAAILEALHEEEGIDAPNIEAAYAQLDEAGKQVGILIPFFRSMNTDINSPLSIAIMAMIFIEFWGISTLGLFRYFGKFFNISSPIGFVVGLLEFIAEIARLISFTFRLFGNMLAGEILLLVMTFLSPFLVALPFYALEVFVGLIQAFVFAMLTLVFGVLAVAAHEGHDDDHEEAHNDAQPALQAAH